MRDALSQWFESRLIPALQLWPQDQPWQLATVLLACVLMCAAAAYLSLRLPLKSEQGKLAVSSLLFLVTGISIARCMIEFSWLPALEGGIAAALLCLPAYFIGIISQLAERKARQAVGRGHGMRERVLEEIRNQQFDPEVFEEAETRAGDDRSKIRSIYIGLRSRKLARMERKPGASADSGDYGYIDFPPADKLVSVERSRTH